MPFIVLALFIGVPLLEIWLFITLGGALGLWPTLGLVLVTAFAGTTLLRHQGMTMMERARGHLASGQMPVGEVFTGMALLVAGVLLLTPGFFTDAVGLALFVPGVRRFVGKSVFSWLLRHGTVTMHTQGFATRPGARPRRPGDPSVIDGDFEDVTESDRGTASPSDPRLPPRA